MYPEGQSKDGGVGVGGVGVGGVGVGTDGEGTEMGVRDGEEDSGSDWQVTLSAQSQYWRVILNKVPGLQLVKPLTTSPFWQ